MLVSNRGGFDPVKDRGRLRESVNLASSSGFDLIGARFNAGRLGEAEPTDLLSVRIPFLNVSKMLVP